MSAEAAGSKEDRAPADADASTGVSVSVDPPGDGPTTAPGRRRWWWPWGGPRRPVEWSPWLGYFVLIWLVDLGLLARSGLQAVPTDDHDVRLYALKVVGALFLAGILTFAVPIALLDESSHRGNRWWLAWLWPVVLVGMLVADFEVGGFVVYPLLKAMKSH